MKKVFGTLAVLTILAISANAQRGWKWPEDSAKRVKAEEKNVIQSDAVKMGDYKTALPALNWLFINTPDLNKSIYINGAKVYDNLADVEKDEARKVQLVDSLMWVYDQRIQHFGDKPYVLNWKAYKGYKYYIKDFSKAEWLLKMFDEAFDIGGEDILDANLIAYMNVIKVNALAKKNLTEDEILDRYDKINDVIEKKMEEKKAKGEDVESLVSKRALIDNILTEIVNINCEFVENNYGPRFEANPDDLKLVKRMFTFMLTGKCTDSPLFLSVAKQLEKLQPDFGLAKVIGTKCLANKDYDCAINYYKEALQYTEDGADKADVYIQLGKVYAVIGQKPTARNMFNQALAANPANKEAYSAIGDLYYHSFNECKEEQDMVKDRLVFIAAYNMYRKAGDSEKMQQAKEQFPSKEELFNGDYEAGQTVNLGCWINESVTLSSRD
ncbi:MAG: hypothetical protein KDC79_01615 [Cyclobacteriaceae bacterium]|nr:hypothetical protein [Cyclobacteriaceae bacterium]